MEAAVEFERCVAGTGILDIVVCKLSHWQKPCPVILFSVYKDSEVCFLYAILSLCLAIGLRIESRRESFLDA